MDQEQIVAEETTLNIANKEILRERLPERIEEQIVGILVPPTVEQIVESVQIIQERFQQSIEEQSVDDPVPQVVEEQLVAVAPTTAATDANIWMENMESLLLLPLTRAAAELLDADMTAVLHPVLYLRQPSDR